MLQSKKQLHNNSIDIFRLLCAVLVVAIHTDPLCDISAPLGDLCTNILPRIAVPFFFITAGYFYISSLENGKDPTIPYLKRILVTYLLWSIPYCLISFCTWGYTMPASFVLECIYAFFINGTSYHFWFFPALILSALLVTCFYRFRCRKLLLPVSILLYAVGCLCCAYDTLALRIPLLDRLLLSPHFLVIRRYLLMGFPFFAAGYLIRRLAERKWSDLAVTVSVLLCAALWGAELVVVRRFELGSDIVITYGLYPLVASVLLCLLRHPLPKHARTAAMCRSAANFMYYAHPLLITLLTFSADLLSVQLSQTPRFLLVVILTVAVSLSIHQSNIPVLKKLLQ